MTGRPTKLTPEIQDRVCAVIRAGAPVEVAAQAVGITERTFYAWMERGAGEKRGDKRYRDFRAAVEQARADAEAILVTRISKAAAKSWQAAAWLLERRHPERYGKGTDRRKDSDGEDEQQPPKDPFEALDQVSDLAAARQRKRAKSSK